MAWPFNSCGAPTTAASATDLCRTSDDSTSMVLKRCPATLITSSTRPSTQIYPSSSTVAASPVKYIPGYRDQYPALNRSGSFQIVRSIAGHGLVSTKNPLPTFTGFPLSSTTAADTPGNGRVAEPGFAAVAPGNGEIRMPPVSVCHHVSTMGQRPSPTTRWYQSQTSGLIGSPTVPSRRSDLRLRFLTGSPPPRALGGVGGGPV